ncbi:MAG: SDR family oxidoreductase [Gammaproteobacteria bacterium]|nr:SDR family oxidoreductase [Gammaproteobacteria bacterium]MDP6617364.1 SDR family oxidoreductase [Gammaproteobacteria bacterium]MDP6694915.1 SDR family oxidoreductase [Gammaproteobacteria bacterium]
MEFSYQRRRFLKAAPALFAAPPVATLSACTSNDLPRPAGVPVGPFGANSTAEEVTAGLDLTGKTALVTGCNSGIGFETMRVLALRGAHVLGAARTPEKAADACASVEGRTTPIVVELTELDTIATTAGQIRSMNIPIDMLICNAGIMQLPELEQVNGFEKQFFVNHIGHFVLVNQLLEQVVASPQGRIINVSSGRATGNPPEEGIQFDNLSGEAGYDPSKAYGQSKLANVLFTLELARRLRDTRATANALRPGVIATNLGRHLPRWQVIALETVGSLFTKTMGQGAATTCYVATAPALSETSGYFFEHCNPIRAGGYTEDTEMAAKLWAVSEEIAAGYV